MGSQKTTQSAAVHMDQLNFKGVSGLTIDEGDDKPKQRWMAKECIGDVVSVQTGRKGKASLIKLLEPSPNRIDPKCPHFDCGGCQFATYSLRAATRTQRKYDSKTLQTLQTVHPIVGAEGYHYRNKWNSPGARLSMRTQEASSATDGSTSVCILGNGTQDCTSF